MRHPDHGRVAVRAGQEGQAGAVELGEQLAVLDARADPRRTALHVDRDPVQAAGAEHQHLVEGIARAVAGRLRGDLYAVVDGPPDRCGDVVGVADLEHRHRVLGDVHEPGGAYGVPGLVGGGVQPADHATAKVLQRVGLVGRGGLGGERAGQGLGHRCSSRDIGSSGEPVSTRLVRLACTPLARHLQASVSGPTKWNVRPRRAGPPAPRSAASTARHSSRSLSTTARSAYSRARGSPRAAYP